MIGRDQEQTYQLAEITTQDIQNRMIDNIKQYNSDNKQEHDRVVKVSKRYIIYKKLVKLKHVIRMFLKKFFLFRLLNILFKMIFKRKS